MESPYLYLGLMIFSLAYPLAQSFERRLTYYKSFKHLLLGALGMMLVFIPWDIWFTKVEVWWFHTDYVTGWFIVGLPIEEWLFFLIVPFACVFIYEALKYFVKTNPLIRSARYLVSVLAIIYAVLAFMYYDNLYTGITAFLAALMAILLARKNPKWLPDFLLMYAVSWVPFILINGALTGMFTKNPVVNYNAAEIIGVRIFTIPVEDSIYNFLMLAIVLVIYEWSKQRSNGRV